MFGEYHASDDGLPDATRDHYTSYSYGSGRSIGSSSDVSGGSDASDGSAGSDGQAIHKRPKRAKSSSYTGNK